MRLRLVWAAMLGVALCGGIAMATQDPIAERKALMKENGSKAGILKGIIIDGKAPLADAVPTADALAADFAKLPSVFPAGSDTGDTRAKPEIWANFAAFEAEAKNAQDLAKAVSAAAASGDMAKAKLAFDQLGKDGCGTCHNDYRKPRS